MQIYSQSNDIVYYIGYSLQISKMIGLYRRNDNVTDL